MTLSEIKYDDIFSRNFGLLTSSELEKVKSARIGIAGMGGCGSNHLITLARMGFQNFSIADPDFFDISNINRQAGAFLSTVGKMKTQTMQHILNDINPNISIRAFNSGITKDNITEFVESTDIGINAIDFFQIGLYGDFHSTYRKFGKPSIVGASPFAFGASLTVISPQSPDFYEFMGFDSNDTHSEMLDKFVKKMTPSRYAQEYLPQGINEIKDPLENTNIASSASALQLCAAITSAEILFMVTGKRSPILAPRVLEIDLHSIQLSVS